MRRREFLFGLSLAAATPRARAQQSRSAKRIGILIGYGAEEAGRWRAEAFERGLRNYGWIAGQNVDVEYRWPNGDEAASRQLAQELVSLKPDLLVGTNTLATAALKRVAGSIPVLFVNVTDPIAAGFVNSFAHPGGNITGFVDLDPAVAGKWVQILKELVPSLKSVALVYNPDLAPFVEHLARPFENAAATIGLSARYVHVYSQSEYDPAFTACSQETGCAFIAVNDGLFARDPKLVADLAREHRVPAIYMDESYVKEDGGLVSFGVDRSALYVQSTSYMDRILKGERPENLPVQLPVEFRLAISLKEAKAIGVTVPATILAQADLILE